MAKEVGALAPKRIVVGADPSPAGSAALLWAMRQARKTDGHVLVLDSQPTNTDPGAGRDGQRKESRHRIHAWVADVMTSVNNRVPVLVSSTEGRIELALAGAGSRADLVVYGQPSDGTSQLEAEVLGRFCPCPVVRVNEHQIAEYLPDT